MGSKTEVHQPTAPPFDPGGATRETVEAYVENLPKIFQAQLEFGPQFTGQQVALQRQFAPELAQQSFDLQQQFAPQLAQQQQDIQRQFEPEAFRAREALGGLFDQPDFLTDASLPDTGVGFEAAKDRLRQDVRGAFAARGLGFSGASAEEEGRLLSEFEFPFALQQEQAQRQELGRRQNLALSLSGRFGMPTQQQVNAPGVPSTNLLQGFNFPSVAGLSSGIFGSQAQASKPFVDFRGDNVNIGPLGKFGLG